MRDIFTAARAFGEIKVLLCISNAIIEIEMYNGVSGAFDCCVTV